MKKYIFSVFLFIISSSVLAEDIFAPTKDEYGLIGNKVFVLKRKPANVVISSYHKWLSISAENRTFRVSGENKDATYKAIALSIPLHLGAIGDSQTEAPYDGYVVGTANIANGQGGRTRVLPMSKIEWASSASSDKYNSTSYR